MWNSSRVMVLVASLSMAPVQVSSAGLASGEEGTFQACAHKRSGYLRILAPGQRCREFERLVELASGERPKRDRRLYVFNGAGEAIGLYAGPLDTSSGLAYRIYVEPHDVSILVKPRDGELVRLGRLFTSVDCQGDSFFSAVSAGIVTRAFDPADPVLYLATPEVLVESAEILSRTRSFGGFCGNNSPDPSTNLVPAVPFDEDLGLDFPVRLPLSIGTLSP